MGFDFRQVGEFSSERVRARNRRLIRAGGAFVASVALVSACAMPSLAVASPSADSSGSVQTAAQSQGGSAQTPPDGEGGSSLGEPPDGQGGGTGGSGSGMEGSGMGDAVGGGGGANTQSFDYSGSYSATLVADGQEVQSDGESVEATESLVNAALAQNGGTLTITNGTLSKSGDASDGDSCNFYGVNSILLAVGEASQAFVSGTQISSTSEGSNGIFATDGATVFANDVEISTEQANSRGLDATYGGTIVANQVSISTQGDHCASFATDRGGGYISVANSDVSTAGSGSPLVYSTGAIEIDNVSGTATGSQIAGMEGLNTILISNSSLESTVTDRTASDPVANGVIIYQSTSGDAETSTGDAARFEAVQSTLSSSIQSGSMFYCTNTTANVVLRDTTLSFDSSAADLVTAAGNDSNSWGQAGSNGATVSFTGIGQTFEGDAVADTISQLSVYLLEGTTWTGATEITQNSVGSTSSTPLTVNVDGSSTWCVTGDCTLSALNVAEGGSVVDSDGKTVTIVADGQTVVQGEGDVTVTVEGAYSTTVEVGEGQQEQGSSIDRSAFDEHFGTSTTFGENGGSQGSSDSDASAGEDQGGFFGWVAGLWSSFLSLFGM